MLNGAPKSLESESGGAELKPKESVYADLGNLENQNQILLVQLMMSLVAEPNCCNKEIVFHRSSSFPNIERPMLSAY